MKCALPLAVICALWPGWTTAHPHVFIDAGLDFRLNAAGGLAAVRVVWAYDEFYSLLTIHDRDMDQDGDGELSDAELMELARSDVDWDDGFPGDLTLRVGETNLPLGPPSGFLALYDNGRLITSHMRPVLDPVDMTQNSVTAQVYDATYYTAYAVTLPVAVRGAPQCNVVRDVADTGAAQALMNRLLGVVPDPETNFPEVGAAFADTFTISCAGS